MIRIWMVMIGLMGIFLLVMLSRGTASEPNPAVRVSSSQDLLVPPEVTMAVPFDQIRYDTGLFDYPSDSDPKLHVSHCGATNMVTFLWWTNIPLYPQKRIDPHWCH